MTWDCVFRQRRSGSPPLASAASSEGKRGSPFPREVEASVDEILRLARRDRPSPPNAKKYPKQGGLPVVTISGLRQGLAHTRYASFPHWIFTQPDGAAWKTLLQEHQNLMGYLDRREIRDAFWEFLGSTSQLPSGKISVEKRPPAGRLEEVREASRRLTDPEGLSEWYVARRKGSQSQGSRSRSPPVSRPTHTEDGIELPPQTVTQTSQASSRTSGEGGGPATREMMSRASEVIYDRVVINVCPVLSGVAVGKPLMTRIWQSTNSSRSHVCLL